MADVFLSYVRVDRNVAQRVARSLEDAGYSVWWDRYIQAGADFSAVIERELAAARAVVVLWSTASVESKWVRDEAAYARDRNSLIPIRLDGTEPPLGFRQVQSLDFARWTGDVGFEAFEMLAESLGRLVRDDGTARTSPLRSVSRPSGAPVRRTQLLWTSAVAVAVIAVAAAWISISRIAPTADPLGSGRILIGDFELLTDDAEAARFAKGLTDTIEQVFTRTVGLEATGHTEAKQANAPVGTEFVVKGTIDSADGKLAVNTDIVHVRDGVVLWSTRHERDAAESRWLQERVALELADILNFALRARRFADGDTSSELAASLMRIYVSTDVAQGMDLSLRFRDAFPQYAISHGICAFWHALGSNDFPAMKPPEELARLRTITVGCAEAALAIDSNDQRGYHALAVVNDPSTTWAQREKLLLKSIDVLPDWHQPVMAYWALLSNVGRIRQARVVLDRLPLDRVQNLPAFRLTRAQVVMRASEQSPLRAAEIDAAREEFAHVAKIWPESDANVSWFLAEHWFGDPQIAARLAKEDSVVRYFSIWSSKHPAQCMSMFLDARARSADLTEAEIDTGCKEGFHTAPESIYGYFGHADAAYREIERRFSSYSRPHFSNPWSRNLFEPYMQVVRADPRFMPLAARLGLVDYWLETDKWPDFCTTEEIPYDCKKAALAAKQALAYQSKSSGT